MHARNSVDDFTLVIDARGGNEAALEELLKRRNRLFYAIANRLAKGDSWLMEDLVQEARLAYMRAVLEGDKVAEDKFMSYAVTSIHHGCMRFLREQHPIFRLSSGTDRPCFCESLELYAEQEDEFRLTPPCLWDLSTQEAIDRWLRHEVLVSLLLRLPENHRKVVMRRVGWDRPEPQTHEEIAHDLCVSRMTTHSWEKKGLAQLRTLVGMGEL